MPTEQETMKASAMSRTEQWNKSVAEAKKSTESFFENVKAQQTFLFTFAKGLKQVGVDIESAILASRNQMQKQVYEAANWKPEFPEK